MKETLQRRLFTLTLFTIWILGLASCGSNPTANSPLGRPSVTPKSFAAKELESIDSSADLQFFHYIHHDWGVKIMADVVGKFEEANPKIKVANNSVDMEIFKISAPVMLQTTDLPDVLSLWPGVRVQAAVEAATLQPLDDLWAKEKFDQVFSKVLAANSTYKGQKYVVPFCYHYFAFFYNKKLFTTIGAEVPQSWAELKAIAEKFKQHGLPAFALGSRERWPAQTWFDYLLLRTAGPTYRAELMAGKRAYTDPEVVRVMQLWQELFDAGYFYPNANGYGWDEAAKFVAEGKAAMTLIGSWTVGYYKDTLKLTEDKDFGYFAFPLVDEGIPPVGVASIDGLVMAKKARHPGAAQKFLTFWTSEEVQKTWTVKQGSLPASSQVDRKNYNPLMQRILQEIDTMQTLALNYDLSTTAPMAEVGLDSFSDFVARPADYPQILQKLEKKRQEILKSP